MELGPINSTNLSAPVNTTTPNESSAAVSAIVTAIRGVNKSELMGEGRELAFSRDPDTRHPVIQVVDRSSGEIVQQIPPETVLQLAAQLEASKGKS